MFSETYNSLLFLCRVLVGAVITFTVLSLSNSNDLALAVVVIAITATGVLLLALTELAKMEYRLALANQANNIRIARDSVKTAKEGGRPVHDYVNDVTYLLIGQSKLMAESARLNMLTVFFGTFKTSEEEMHHIRQLAQAEVDRLYQNHAA